jgi:hypothetical protein
LVERNEDGFTVDAAEIAEGLKLDPAEVQGLLRRGMIAAVYERGAGEDEGRHRLTFTYRHRRLQLVTDGCGKIRSRSTLDIGAEPLSRRA